MRLAHQAGVPVDRYLAQFTPEAFDEEVAFDKIDPEPLERIRVILKYGLAAISQNMPVKPSDLDSVKMETAPATNTHTPAQAVAAIRLTYGG